VTSPASGPAAAPDAVAAALAADLVAIISHLAAPAGAAGQPAAAPAGAQLTESGVVKIRLSGDRAAIQTAAAMLAAAGQVLDRSGPRPNRYDPGERVYLAIRIGAGPARL
jgi:hypothetical protein